jgi:hypothetical protein
MERIENWLHFMTVHTASKPFFGIAKWHPAMSFLDKNVN